MISDIVDLISEHLLRCDIADTCVFDDKNVQQSMIVCFVCHKTDPWPDKMQCVSMISLYA